MFYTFAISNEPPVFLRLRSLWNVFASAISIEPYVFLGLSSFQKIFYAFAILNEPLVFLRLHSFRNVLHFHDFASALGIFEALFLPESFTVLRFCMSP
jgi:hypothetical protein